jgi:hypothetical protein
MKRYEFHLRISSEQYLGHYRRVVRDVIARCTDGQTVQFPAALLRRLVTTNGIHGDFILTGDDNGKCIELRSANPKM